MTKTIPRSKTIWGRPHSNVPALRLGSIELRELLSRELDEANLVLDEWNFARTRDKQSGTSQSDASSVANTRGAATGVPRVPVDILK